MSDTASFVDPVFLARFGLSRVNVLDYFLHPLNPFRTKNNTSNEVLSMQNIGIGTLMAQGTGIKPGPMSLRAAEEEYATALSYLTGEQYELIPETEALDNIIAQQQQQQQDAPPLPAPLCTVRYVLRSNPITVKVLGIFYVLEGVIYKSPSVRSLMKANVTRTIKGLDEACQELSVCARYDPSTGYTWDFEANDYDEQADDDDNDDENNNCNKYIEKMALQRKKRARRVLDHRRPGERTADEEEGIRASEAIDRILLRISKSPIVVTGKDS